MKSLKPILTAVAAIILSVAVGLSMVTANDDTRPDFAVSDTALPQARIHVSGINGKDWDVYLQSLDVRVEVIGNIASTRYMMVFKNITKKKVEGFLNFPLPEGRCVTYYALDVNDTLRKAMPVEKAGWGCFRQLEERRTDTASLKRAEGNNFRAYIYPIPAGGTRKVSIGYEEELPLEKGMFRYRMPMAYAGSLERFAVNATVRKSAQKPIVPVSDAALVFDKAGESYVASFVCKNYCSARPLVFALPASADGPRVITQSAGKSNYFLASVAPELETRKKQWGSELAIIWDVSLSASLRDLRREMEILDIIFSQKKNADVYLYFLNNKFKKIADKNTATGAYKVINGKWNGLKKTLEAAAFDGGTDFSELNLNSVAGNEMLLFSDGVSTLSDADFLQNAKINRPIHCVVSSASADCGSMKLIAGKTKGKYLNVNDLSSEKLKEELLNDTPRFLGTEHENVVCEVYPSVATPVYGEFSVAGIADTNKTELTLLFGYGNKVTKRVKVQLDAKKTENRKNIHRIWAQKKIAELDLDYKRNGDELTALGKQFGIVTRSTSLIVLETVDDYIRRNVTPPVELQTIEYLSERKLRNDEVELNYKKQRRKDERYRLKTAVKAARDVKEWWDTEFKPPKPEYPTPDDERQWPGVVGYGYGGSSGDPCYFYNQTVGSLVEREERKSRPAFMVKPVREDNDYLDKLTGKNADDYQLYLKLRDDYVGSPTFYFDMANRFYTRSDKETAFRILTSIADLELENAPLYRTLAYSFKEYGEYALAKFVCEKVIRWQPRESQSYRDYALALADNGETQAALDSLYSMLIKEYRGSGMEEILITEINYLINKNPRLNTSKIDRRLIMDILPVDIRVAINMNTGSDISLRVEDPNKEVCHYNHKETVIGGRMSGRRGVRDFDRSCGLQQFLLKKAVKGKYLISVVNDGGSLFVVDDGPPTVMAEIYTKYADKSEQRRIVCLQLSKAKKIGYGEKLVAEIEF